MMKKSRNECTTLMQIQDCLLCTRFPVKRGIVVSTPRCSPQLTPCCCCCSASWDQVIRPSAGMIDTKTAVRRQQTGERGFLDVNTLLGAIVPGGDLPSNYLASMQCINAFNSKH